MSESPALQVSVLASGSKGNCLYVESEKRKFLVDAGLSGKKITALLNQIDRTPNDLDGILVTHEHRDHVSGVGVLARKYHLDVYANEKTWQAMEPIVGKIDVNQKNVFKMGKTMTIGDLDIESFGVSHDAAAPQFYRFYKNDKSFVVMTDTGYCSDHVRGTIKNADAYLLESNHDIEMLRMGAYPWSLKQRILGDHGHLSNEDGALVMCDTIGDKTKRIFLGHLSKENNLKELAYMTVETILKEHDKGVHDTFELYHTDQEIPTDLFAV